MTLIEKLRSQIGDDIQHVFDHEVLFRLAAARIEELEADLATARNDALEEATLAVCRVVFFSERDSDLNAYVCQCASNAIRALKSTNQT